jgi:hypothetical protein
MLYIWICLAKHFILAHAPDSYNVSALYGPLNPILCIQFQFVCSNLEYNIKMTLDDLEILIYYSPYIKIFYYESCMSIGGAT